MPAFRRVPTKPRLPRAKTRPGWRRASPGPRQAPTLSAVAESTWGVTAATLTTTTGGSDGAGSLTWATGDTIIVAAMTADQGITYSGAPTATGLTFTTLTGPNTGASTCRGQVWTATATTAGSGAVTLTSNNVGFYGLAAVVASGTNGVRATIDETTAVTTSYTTKPANSAILELIGDWGHAAVTGAAATPATGSSTFEQTAYGTGYSIFGYVWADRGAPATTSYGIGGSYAASGSNYTKIVVEVLGVDVQAFAYAATPTDSTGLTDTGVARNITATRTDLAGLTDSASASKFTQFTATITDGAGLADTAAGTSAFARIQSDDAGLTDATTVQFTPGGFTRQQDDSTGLTDAVAVDQAKTVTDSVGLTDAAGSAVGKSVTDPAGSTDAVALAVSLAVTDAAGIADALALGIAATASDPTGLTDSLTVQTAGAGTRQVDDPAGLTDAAAKDEQKVRTDSTGLTDAGLVQTRTVVGIDAAGLTDSVTAQLIVPISRTLTDPAGLTDLDQPLAVDITDTQTDISGLTDAVSVLVGRTLTDPAGLTDTVRPEVGRTVADTTGLTDTASPASASARTVDDPAGLTDTQAFAFAATSTDSAGLTDSASASLSTAGSRTVNDTAGLTDAAGKDESKAQTDPAGLTDAVTPVTAFARTVDDAAGPTDARALALSATVTDPAGPTDAAALAGAYLRALTDSTGLADDVTRAVASALNQAVIDSAGLRDSLYTDFGRVPTVTGQPVVTGDLDRASVSGDAGVAGVIGDRVPALVT